MNIRRKSLAFILILLIACAFSFIACKETSDSSKLDSVIGSSVVSESTQQESSLVVSTQEESSLETESSSEKESSLETESSSEKESSLETESSGEKESSLGTESSSEEESSMEEESSIEEESAVEDDSSIETVPPCSHNWEEESRKEYCDAYGVRVLACGLCCEKMAESVEPIGHIEVSEKAYSATCEREGKTLSISCERCGEVLLEAETSPKVDHQYVDSACKWCGLAILNFELREDGYYCIGTDASDARRIVVPDEYKGEPVVGIAKHSFGSRHGLNSLTIGKNVKVIEAYSFDYCYNLVEVYDFSDAHVTDNPVNMVDLKEYVLDVYTQPVESKLHRDLDGYMTYNWVDNSGEEQVVFLGYKGERPIDNTLRIPKGVSIINWYSVSPTKWARRIILSDTVKYIRRFAFYFCPNLEELTIGENVEKIDIDLFDFDNVLKAVVFANTEIEDWRICFEKDLGKGWYALGYPLDDPEILAQRFKPKPWDAPEEQIDYSKMYWKKYWVTLFP